MEEIPARESIAWILAGRSLVCVGALFLDGALERVRGLPPSSSLWHPVALFGNLAARGERLVRNNALLSRLLSPFWLGALLCGALAGGAFVVGFGIELLLWRLGLLGVLSGGILLCGLLIAHASLNRHVGRVEVALSNNRLAAARRHLSHIVGRDTKRLPKEAVARAALESLAENCSDGTVAPLFWYILFGVAGLFFYKAVNTLDSMFGYRGVRYGLFGRCAARLDDLVNIVPSRMTAWSFCVVALFMRGYSGSNAFRVLRAYGLSLRGWIREGFVSSPNALPTEAAMAGALGVRLGGVREYRMHGEVWRVGKWVGDGKARCDACQIARARELVEGALLSLFLGLMACGGLWWLAVLL